MKIKEDSGVCSIDTDDFDITTSVMILEEGVVRVATTYIDKNTAKVKRCHCRIVLIQPLIPLAPESMETNKQISANLINKMSNDKKEALRADMIKNGYVDVDTDEKMIDQYDNYLYLYVLNQLKIKHDEKIRP